MQGMGKMAFSNGMHYDGEWAENLFCGDGSLHLVDKRVIKGTWLECGLVEGEILEPEPVGSDSSFIS